MARYLHPANHHPVRIRKADILLGDELGFADVTFSVKIKDIPKNEKKIYEH